MALIDMPDPAAPWVLSGGGSSLVRCNLMAPGVGRPSLLRFDTDGFMHVRDAVIMPLGEDSVRASVRRLVRGKWRDLRWRLGIGR